VNVVCGSKVYDKDVYLEVHDPDHLEEASSTITRPTGGHPPVTYPPPFIKTLLRKVKKTAKENRKEKQQRKQNRTPKTIPSIASPPLPSHPSLLPFHRTNHITSQRPLSLRSAPAHVTEVVEK
jgi:hypothetical protein